MSDETVGPALTPEEWVRALYEYPGHPRENILDYDTATEGATPEAAHYIAALALYGQPFGFTWQDVRLLTGLVGWQAARKDAALLRGLADRIAALLPPETS